MLVVVGAVGLFIASLAMIVGGSVSVIEVTTNFRPHLLVLATGLSAVALVVHRPAAVAAFAAALIFLPSTLPYLVNEPVVTQPGAAEITALQFNTLYSNDDVAAIADVVLDANADVVALHEMTPDRWSELQPLVAASYPHFVNGLDEPLAEIRTFGTVLLSKTPLRSVTDEAPPIAPVAAVTEIHDQEILAIGLHPSPSRTDAEKIAARNTLLDATQSLADAHDGPALVIADLNITPTSPEYSEFLEELDWPDSRRTLGIAPTFPAGLGNPIGIAIDHVFASPEFVVTDFERGDDGGSDHVSLLATVEVVTAP